VVGDVEDEVDPTLGLGFQGAVVPNVLAPSVSHVDVEAKVRFTPYLAGQVSGFWYHKGTRVPSQDP
jgi:hypothetical protein